MSAQPKTKRILATTLTFLLAILSLTTTAAGSEAKTKGPTRAQLEARLGYNRGLNTICSGFHEAQPLCVSGKNPDTVLWGDSFAMQLADTLKYSIHPVSFVQQTKSVCAPILNIAPQNSIQKETWAKACVANNNSVLDWIKRHKNIKYAVLAGHWVNVLAQHETIYADGKIGNYPDISFKEFANTLKALEKIGVKPIVVTETPTNKADHATCVVNALVAQTSTSKCDFPRSADTEHALNQTIAQSATDAGAGVYWLENHLCDTQTCWTMRDNKIVYRDSHHLTIEESIYLGQKFDVGQEILAAAKR